MRTFVTGSTDPIGIHLVRALVRSGHHVVAATPEPAPAATFGWPGTVETRRFDSADPDSIGAAIDGSDVAYYLTQGFDDSGCEAKAFIAASSHTRLQLIVYVSGTVTGAGNFEHHSHPDVERIFLEADTPARIVRMAPPASAQSVPSKIVHHLIDHLPIQATPQWTSTRTEPITNIDDVVAALIDAGTAPPANAHYDLDGPDRLTYPDLVAPIIDDLDLTVPVKPPQIRNAVPTTPTWTAGHPPENRHNR